MSRLVLGCVFAYIGCVVPLRYKLGEPTSVTWESNISCSVRESSVAEEAGTRGEDTHLLEGGFIIASAGGVFFVSARLAVLRAAVSGENLAPAPF